MDVINQSPITFRSTIPKKEILMTRNKYVIPLIVSALVMVLGIGAFSYHAVSAAVPASMLANNILAHRGGNPELNDGYLKGADEQYLADALGITVDELDAAVQEANTAALAQAVEKGLITQAQADKFSLNRKGFPFGDHGGMKFNDSEIDYNSLLADALGISVEKLQSAYTDAFNARITQAIADGNLTQEQADLALGRFALGNSSNFQTAMQSAYETAVQQAVKDGVITQAQADQLLQNVPPMGLAGKHGMDVWDGGFGHLPHGGEWSRIPENSIEPGTTP
jgi:hypothetical protein